MKKTNNLIALLLVCMMLISVLPAAALADADTISMMDVWTKLGTKTFDAYGYTLVAGGEGDSAFFSFESPEHTVYSLPVGDRTLSYSDDWGSYVFESEDLYVEVSLKDGELYYIFISGNDLYDADDNDYGGLYTEVGREPDGSSYYPWFVGASAEDEVYASCEEGAIMITGSGRMADFDDLADRPWNDAAETVWNIMIDTTVTYIGKNAFNGLGGEDPVYVSLDEGLLEIGESAFENISTGEEDYCFNIPATVTAIGSRAFAGVTATDFAFFGDCPEIADDAFAGVTAAVSVVNGTDWTEEDMKDYGGSLTYQTLFTIRIIEEYTDDTTGESIMYAPGGEIEFSLANTWDGYAFKSFEVLEGTLPDDIDLTNPEVKFNICDNVILKVYYDCTTEPVDGDDDSDADDDSDVGGDVDKPTDVDPEDNPKQESEPKTDKDTPETSDLTNTELFVCVVAAALTCLAFVEIVDKKEKA